jgi:N-acetylmuramoyl-L-alanine amidase
LTIQDPNQQYKPSNVTCFSHDTDEVILTSPVYPNEDAHVSANLRWYLANEIYRKELKNGTPSDKVIFASLHCDALYTPQLRGAMVYVPGAQYRRDSEQPGGAIYANYSEVKQQPVVKTTYAQRVEDEALSRNFAQTLLNCLQANDPPIKVHDAGDPIRNVIRQSGGRAYVPAVLRNAVIPTKVLVETANLTNTVDCQRVADPQWRQGFANSFVVALRKHFASQNAPVQVAANQ